jgi:hypothetical protein
VGLLFMTWGQGFLVQLADGGSQLADGGSAAGAHTNYVSPPISVPDASGVLHGFLDGNFHHVTLSVTRSDPAGGKVYVDGQLVWTFNPMGRTGSLNTTAPLTIGHGYDKGPIDGNIDEVMIWQRALTPSEINSMFTAGAHGVCH